MILKVYFITHFRCYKLISQWICSHSACEHHGVSNERHMDCLLNIKAPGSSKKDNIANLLYYSLLFVTHALEQTVDLAVIWDAMTLTIMKPMLQDQWQPLNWLHFIWNKSNSFYGNSVGHLISRLVENSAATLYTHCASSNELILIVSLFD